MQFLPINTVCLNFRKFQNYEIQIKILHLPAEPWRGCFKKKHLKFDLSQNKKLQKTPDDKINKKKAYSEKKNDREISEFGRKQNKV